MNFAQRWIAFRTILVKEVRRILRIWPQTLLPPVITMSLYFVIFGNGRCAVYAVYRAWFDYDGDYHQQLF